MATLEGQQIKNSYKDLLQVSNSNSGVDGTLRNIEDGEGTTSALQLSSSAAKVAGNLTVTGNVVFNDGTTLSTAPAGGTDQSVKVSSNDTTAGFLNGKLVGGSSISLTEGTDGGNETLTIAYTGSASGINNVVEDTSPQLGGSLDVQTNYIITAASNRNVEVAAHGTGQFVVRGNTNPGAIALNCENNSHAVVVKSPTHASGGNYSLTLPTADAAGAMVSDGSGTLSFNTQLGTIGGLSNADGNFIVGNGSSFTVENSGTARASLGLGTMATAATSDYLALAGGTLTGTLVAHSSGIQYSDGTTQTTAASAGISTGKAIAMAMVFG